MDNHKGCPYREQSMTYTLKPYPAYKPSGVGWLGEIPSGWNVAKVKYSSYLKARIGWQNLRTDEFVENGPYCVTGTDFKNGKIDWTNCYHVSQARYELDPKIQLDSNDILITKDGTIGKVAHVEELLDCATLNSGVFVVRPLKESYSTRFMYWVLSSDVFGSFIDYIRNGSTIHHLYQHSFERFQFPVPSKGEQHRIARFLDQKTAEIDEAINKKQRLIELLKEQKAILINQAVTKGLNPNVPMRDSGVEWIGEVPAHWEVLPLTKYVKSIVDYRGKTPTKVEFGTFLVTAKNIKNGEIDYEASKEYVATHQYEKIMSRGKPRRGDILFTTEAPLGDVAVVDREDVALAQRIIKFRPQEEWLLPEFIKHSILSSYFQKRLSSEATGSTAQGIKASKLHKLRIITPPIEEQRLILQEIETRSTEIDTCVESTASEIRLLSELRKIIISQAVTGKIKV